MAKQGIPLVDVLVITYDRLEVLTKTWRALKGRLHYPNLRWVIADDHSPDDVAVAMREELQPDIFFRTRKRSGWGINVNNALKNLTSEFVFQVEDDYVLKSRHIDLMPGVDILARFPEFGMVRYGGIGGHDLTCRYRQIEAMPSAIFDKAPTRYQIWEILKKESHFLFVYSHAPHLKHRRFHTAYGYYAEGYKMGLTEEAFAHRFRDVQDGPSIFVLPEFVSSGFVHVGKTRQHTKHDIGKEHP